MIYGRISSRLAENLQISPNRKLSHNNPMSLDRPLSTLELTALGIVLKSGPCLAHAVVTMFASSQTYAYRSGAGSIYPLLKRLASAGYLQESKRQYIITEAGKEAIRAWVKPPFEPSDFSTTLDTFRSRAYFLTLLSPSEIDEFTAKTLEGLNGLLVECSQALEAQRDSGDRFGELAMLGAVRETQARIMWMSEVRHALLSANLVHEGSESNRQ